MSWALRGEIITQKNNTLKSATLYLWSLWYLWPINRDKPYLRASEGWDNCSIFYLLAVCLHFQKLVIGKILGVLTMTVFGKLLNFGFTKFQEFNPLLGHSTIAMPFLSWPHFYSKFKHSCSVTTVAKFWWQGSS